MFDHEMVRLMGALWLGQQTLEQKFRAHAAGVGRLAQRRRHRTREEALRYLEAARADVRAATVRINRQLTDTVRPELAARELTAGTEELLDLIAELRDQIVPAELEPARSLALRLADAPLHQIRDLVHNGIATLGDSAGRPPPPRVGLDPRLEAELARALLAAQGDRRPQLYS